MEAKLLAVFSSGVPLKVTALCRDLGSLGRPRISTDGALSSRGPQGWSNDLVVRSQRPDGSPLSPRRPSSGFARSCPLNAVPRPSPITWPVGGRPRHRSRRSTECSCAVEWSSPSQISGPRSPGSGLYGRAQTTLGRSTPLPGPSLMDRRCGSWMCLTTTPAPWSQLASIPGLQPRLLGRHSPLRSRTGACQRGS
jgi:hypothetical protein